MDEHRYRDGSTPSPSLDEIAIAADSKVTFSLPHGRHANVMRDAIDLPGSFEEYLETRQCVPGNEGRLALADKAAVLAALILAGWRGGRRTWEGRRYLPACRRSSVVIARLEEVHRVFRDQIDDAVLLGEPTRPGSGEKMLQRLRLSDPREWLAQDGLNQVEGAQRHLSIRLYPVTKVLAKFRLEYGDARTHWLAPLASLTCQGPRPSEGRPPCVASLCDLALAALRAGVVLHFSATAGGEPSP